jgi:hypothetical protein
MKNFWVKWWVIITIKTSQISLNWNNFILKTSNKFQKKLIENKQILDIIIKSLNEMWILSPEIKIN